MKSQRVLLIASVVLLTLVLTTNGAAAQGPKGAQPRAPRTALSTTFTYQGQLKQSGSAYTGTCDMQFALFDAASSGTQIGTTQTVPNVTVANGLFTVTTLNGDGEFGTSAFDGNKRFLQIAVKCGSETTYTPLTPLQELTATPYALFSANAGTATTATTATNFSGALSGDATGAQGSTSVVALRGVGISTTAPTNGQVLQYNGTQWTPFTLATGATWNLTGNSGTTYGTNFLGTTDNVSLTLRVNNQGALRLEPNATSPNVIGGYSGNSVTSGVQGATIGGGGASGHVNSVGAYYATVGGGYSNNASGNYATVPGGYGANATHYGEMAYASGRFLNGDAQTSLYVVRGATTDATPQDLFLDGSGQRITIASGRTVAFDILVVARSSYAASAGFRIVGVIKGLNGPPAFVGVPVVTSLGADAAAAGWTAVAIADGPNGALDVQVTGAVATAIHWVASVRTAEMSY